MAFQRKRKIYKLDFSDTDYDGLEVKVQGLTTGEYLELVSLSGATDERNNETEQLLKMLASHLVEWNLQEDGVAVPVSFDGVKTNDLAMNMFIIDAWTDAMANISASTGKKSIAGDPSLVASIPTETLS